jgi:LCP family protein required for cell wall assembly
MSLPPEVAWRGHEAAPHRQRRFAGALGFTVLGAVLPGTNFLAAGRRKLGVVTLVVFLLLVGGLAWLATAGRQEAARIAVNRGLLLGVIGAAAVVGVLWLLVLVLGYRMLAPRGTSRLQHLLGGLVVLALAAGVALPAYKVSQLASVQRDLIGGLFHQHKRSATVDDKPNPFAGKQRVNVLLLGGDAGPGREGVRTDTVMVASIDTKTGSTLLFSLPRNLENLPFPPGSPLAAAYPDGFQGQNEDDSLLNAVYEMGPQTHPNILGPTDYPGGDFLKLGVGQALGLHIDYFVLVNMDGFAKIVDILGGITVNTNYWVPINGDQATGELPDDYFAPGANQHLDGEQALQWARGRFGLNDYLRMQRQRCAVSAMIAVSKPSKVLSQYQQLASTTQDIVTTDIPESALADFVDLAFKVKGTKVHSLVFDESLIDPAYPDYDHMRQLVRDALAAPATSSSAPASPSSSSSSASSSSAVPPPESPSGSAAPGSVSGSPVADVSNACAYDPAQAQAALASGKPPSKRG